MPILQPSTQPLLDLLSGHKPAGSREADSLARIRMLVTDTQEPFARRQFEPGHLTASAVVVDPNRTRTVLIHHQKLDRWLQPGGHFEPGELDPLQCAQREVLEETGLTTRPPRSHSALLDVDVHEIPARKDEPAHEHFDLRFLLIVEGGEAAAGDGAAALRWAAPCDLAGLDLDPGLLRALAKVDWRN